MVDFNLKRLHVSEETLAEYVFPIEGEPSIWFAPAVDANAPFNNESIRMSVEAAEAEAALPQGAARKKSILTPEDVAVAREKDRYLLSHFCAKKWGTPPVDVQGNPVEFSPAVCLELFQQLPNYLFDPLRGWVTNARNFVPKSTVSQAAADKVGNV